MATAAELRRMVAGNWKMNLDLDQGRDLISKCLEKLTEEHASVVFCTPAIHFAAASELLSASNTCFLGAQDVSRYASGAHTGELSATQLKSAGVAYSIIGHSERRKDHGEAGTILQEKVDQALSLGLKPIYCFGETLQQREAGNEQQIVAEQLEEGIGHLTAEQMQHVVLAYEPVWAIGTGKTASPAQAQAIHAFIRSWLVDRFGESRAEHTSILYGGSVKPANASELFGQHDIDGGLIGGASLKPDDFVAIVNAYS